MLANVARFTVRSLDQKMLAALLLPVAVLAQDVVPARLDLELRNYLRLTDTQFGTIFRNTAQHRAAQTGALTRVATLNREIENETRREQPDPGALGASYQEIESQCRRYAESLRELNQQQLRVLKDEQRAALRGLAEQARLSPLVPLAGAVFLIPKRDGTNEFRWTDIVLINDVPAELAVYLGLSPAQLESLRGAVRGHRDFVAARRARVGEVNQEIEAEISRPAPSGIELGMRYWEIEAHRRQITEREVSFRRNLPELLNAEQRARLSLLVQPADRLETISQAESNGLIGASAESLPASRPGTLPFLLTSVIDLAFPIGELAPQGPGRSCVGARPVLIADPVRPR